MHRLLRKSQTRIVLSSLADIKYLPPGWNTNSRTQLSWPVNTNKHNPTLTSQTLKKRKIKFNIKTVLFVGRVGSYVCATDTAANSDSLKEQKIKISNSHSSPIISQKVKYYIIYNVKCLKAKYRQVPLIEEKLDTHPNPSACVTPSYSDHTIYYIHKNGIILKLSYHLSKWV